MTNLEQLAARVLTLELALQELLRALGLQDGGARLHARLDQIDAGGEPEKTPAASASL